MSFSVRFNAEDEEVEGLCTTPTKLSSTGIYIFLEISTIDFNNQRKIIISF